MKFSLLMSIYIKDNPEHFYESLNSIAMSTVIPDDICIVCDGPISEEQSAILNEFGNLLPIQLIKLKENVGLGLALREGVKNCKYDLIARFDSDDICHPLRFEKQLAFMTENCMTAIVGSWIAEFEVTSEQCHAIKKVPITNHEIVRYARSRNPFNHMSVMYRKSAIIKSGNYQNNFLYEDYALWVRVILNGFQTANLPEVLVYARTGNGMEVRRGGVKYVRSEVLAQYGFYKNGFISGPKLARNILLRTPVRLIPGAFRLFLYRKLLRN